MDIPKQGISHKISSGTELVTMQAFSAVLCIDITACSYF